MELAGNVAVVTGGASGIGRALCRRFAAEGASVVVADVDAPGAAAVAQEIDGVAVPADMSVEADVAALIDAARLSFGRIDLFCANAGILAGSPPADPAACIGPDASDEDWERMWRVNVVSHIYAARALVPLMLDQGGGYILVTASAAGLLTMLGNAPYAVTKHAAVAFAEWLAVTYGDQGLRVSCLCPQLVRTEMLAAAMPSAEQQGIAHLGVLEPEDVAEAVVKGLREERFLILPHPEVTDYFQRKAGDYDRWLAGMRRLQAGG
ncbi:MAG TPA: SDR family oxidoreductase [Acidimicrobiia bacterium]|jgi:NAD(P)-dependent dehydrogenase (short-subunit alcohol dehydrogenase family)|nr:SDR family oxidoreductase [Acidimicrobiia bacterium]